MMKNLSFIDVEKLHEAFSKEGLTSHERTDILKDVVCEWMNMNDDVVKRNLRRHDDHSAQVDGKTIYMRGVMTGLAMVLFTIE